MATATPVTTGAPRPPEVSLSAARPTIEAAGILARDAVTHPSLPVSPWFRRVAIGLGAMRVGLGLAALVLPETAGRAWIGEGASGRDKAVLVRSLGGRDIALGAGTLLSSRHGGELRRWVLLGALSDFFDTLATAAGFTELPKWRRWLVLLASGGAAATGVLVAPNLTSPPA